MSAERRPPADKPWGPPQFAGQEYALEEDSNIIQLPTRDEGPSRQTPWSTPPSPLRESGTPEQPTSDAIRPDPPDRIATHHGRDAIHMAGHLAAKGGRAGARTVKKAEHLGAAVTVKPLKKSFTSLAGRLRYKHPWISIFTSAGVAAGAIAGIGGTATYTWHHKDDALEWVADRSKEGANKTADESRDLAIHALDTGSQAMLDLPVYPFKIAKWELEHVGQIDDGVRGVGQAFERFDNMLDEQAGDKPADELPQYSPSPEQNQDVVDRIAPFLALIPPEMQPQFTFYQITDGKSGFQIVDRLEDDGQPPHDIRIRINTADEHDDTKTLQNLATLSTLTILNRSHGDVMQQAVNNTLSSGSYVLQNNAGSASMRNKFLIGRNTPSSTTNEGDSYKDEPKPSTLTQAAATLLLRPETFLERRVYDGTIDIRQREIAEVALAYLSAFEPFRDPSMDQITHLASLGYDPAVIAELQHLAATK